MTGLDNDLNAAAGTLSGAGLQQRAKPVVVTDQGILAEAPRSRRSRAARTYQEGGVPVHPVNAKARQVSALTPTSGPASPCAGGLVRRGQIDPHQHPLGREKRRRDGAGPRFARSPHHHAPRPDSAAAGRVPDRHAPAMRELKPHREETSQTRCSTTSGTVPACRFPTGATIASPACASARHWNSVALDAGAGPTTSSCRRTWRSRQHAPAQLARKGEARVLARPSANA